MAAVATSNGHRSNALSNDAVHSQLIQSARTMVTKVDCARVGDQGYRNPPLMNIKYQRLVELSQPRGLATGFQLDRRSVYWIDKVPFTPGTDGVTLFAGGDRLEYLSKAKSDAYTEFVEDRDEPVWPVTTSAKQFTPSDRLKSLAEPRYRPPDAWPHGYKLCRPPIYEVPAAAQNAKATGRIEQLSAPIGRKVRQDEDADESARTISDPSVVIPPAALRANCSERVQDLSAHKEVRKEYRPMNTVARPVTTPAQHAVATPRVQHLARPKSAKMKTDDYEPFHVSAFAKRAVASPRVCELSIPLARKVRTK